MVIDQLSKEDQEIVLLCLRAIADGPFIEDCCIHSVIGLERDEIKQVLNQWPNISDTGPNSRAVLAIKNCMATICDYPMKFADGEWQEWFPVSIDAVHSAFKNVTRSALIVLAAIVLCLDCVSSEAFAQERQNRNDDLLQMLGTAANSAKDRDSKIWERVFYSGLSDQWTKAYLQGQQAESQRIWAKILKEMNDVGCCYFFVARLYGRIEIAGPDDAPNNSKFGMLPFSQTLLSETERAVGPDHRFVADILGFMYMHYRSVHDFKGYLPLGRREVAIREKCFGPDAQPTLWAAHDVAFCLAQTGRYDEASRLIDRVVSVSRQRKYEGLFDASLKTQEQITAAAQKR